VFVGDGSGIVVSVIGCWRVVAHEPWGAAVVSMEDPSVLGTISIPYLRDLGPGERIDGVAGFPAIGAVLRARTQYVDSEGAHHLTARASDLA
jgi:hypothetical protein